jgi:hypothetical protein
MMPPGLAGCQAKIKKFRPIPMGIALGKEFAAQLFGFQAAICDRDANGHARG